LKNWSIREVLSNAGRLRRSYYEMLRDEMDQFMIRYALIDSYQNFKKHKVTYPFVEKRELKPRAIIPDVEYERHNTFLVLFIEDTIPALHKKYIRFFDVNKTTKTNLTHSKTLALSDNFDRSQKYFDSVHFLDFVNVLLPVDYALLIQRDPTSRFKDRYTLSHFHVRIDWPIADAAEDLGRSLRYISKDLFEKGDKHAEDLQKKFFEYYGLPVMAGGRRTAAIVASQYLRRIPCISTVYVGSSESRSLIRISERGVSKTILYKLKKEEIKQITELHQMKLGTFSKNYIVAKVGKHSIGIFQSYYDLTAHSRPPDDGKLRDLKPDLSWLTVGGQYLIPKPGVWKYPPLPINLIYT
jgi:hypothetical protein